VSAKYGRRDEACPLSTGGGTRRVRLVRGMVGGTCRFSRTLALGCPPHGPSPRCPAPRARLSADSVFVRGTRVQEAAACRLQPDSRCFVRAVADLGLVVFGLRPVHPLPFPVLSGQASSLPPY